MFTIIAAIAALVCFLLALVFHLVGAGYGEPFVLIGLVCVGIWMLVRSLPLLPRR